MHSINHLIRSIKPFDVFDESFDTFDKPFGAFDKLFDAFDKSFDGNHLVRSINPIRYIWPLESSKFMC